MESSEISVYKRQSLSVCLFVLYRNGYWSTNKKNHDQFWNQLIKI